MGWQHERDGHGKHEGYVAGYVKEDGLWRQLGYPADTLEGPVDAVGAACECGWRSPRKLVFGASWSPFIVHMDKHGEEELARLWESHVIEEIEAGR